MKMVCAIIKPFKLDDVREAIADLGVHRDRTRHQDREHRAGNQGSRRIPDANDHQHAGSEFEHTDDLPQPVRQTVDAKLLDHGFGVAAACATRDGHLRHHTSAACVRCARSRCLHLRRVQEKVRRH